MEDNFSAMTSADQNSDVSSVMRVVVSTNSPLMKNEFIDSDCDDIYLVEFEGEDPVPIHSEAEETDTFNSEVAVTMNDDYQSLAMANLTTVILPDGSQAFIASTATNGEIMEMSDSEIAYVQAQILSEPSTEQSNTSFMRVQTMNNDEALAMDETEELHGKKHACSFEGCERRYTTKHHLRVHERVHTGERPYTCTTCNRTFATSYSLKTHHRTHTGIRPFQCTYDECRKSFKTSGDLQKHIRTHTGERPFTCPVSGCERSFTTTNIMKVHMRTHTGERPYGCKYCDKRFSSTTNYRNHERIHTGDKPYICSVESCGKRFTEYSSLYKHQAVHAPSRQYKCDICYRVFKQAQTLETHYLSTHSLINSNIRSDRISTDSLDLLSVIQTDEEGGESNSETGFIDSETLIGLKTGQSST